MKTALERYCLTAFLVILSACSSWKEAAEVSDAEPVMFPDYSGVTVPSGIAPLNFMVEDAGHVQAVFCAGGSEIAEVKGNDGIIAVPAKTWKRILSAGADTSVSVEVSAWSDEHPDGLRYRPFKFNVAEDEIDPWVAYRLIEPGYIGWRQLGIYQRNLSSFEEVPIVTNRESNTTCLNCHHFPSHSSESMLFHARGAGGGTILYDGGVLKKIDFKSIGQGKSATYPAWHPDGRFIAFSSNTTHQIFFAEGDHPIEVFDSASDLILYDVLTSEVLTDPRFNTGQSLETFPAWSADGRYLYFVSSDNTGLDVKFTPSARYHLLRVSFDPQTRIFGEKVDTLYNAYTRGGSISHPRLSPDGRYMLYTWSSYGTFPIWHAEADLRMLDLQTMEDVDVSVWNDPDDADSYHAWSSNGRWVLIGSRRLDGRYTRIYIAHLSEDGIPGKPFLLPQEDPRHDLWRLKSYNIPEFTDGKVILPKEAAELFKTQAR